MTSVKEYQVTIGVYSERQDVPPIIVHGIVRARSPHHARRVTLERVWAQDMLVSEILELQRIPEKKRKERE